MLYGLNLLLCFVWVCVIETASYYVKKNNWHDLSESNQFSKSMNFSDDHCCKAISDQPARNLNAPNGMKNKNIKHYRITWSEL